MYLTIKELADIAGVTPKTLRYYDTIKLLTPHHHTDSGYRMYSQTEIDHLHNILLYKNLGLPLDKIKHLLTENTEQLSLLKQHYSLLVEEQQRLSALLINLTETINSLEGGKNMSNKQKFIAFKNDLVENEKKYGDALRNNYGNKVMETSQKAMSQMTEDDYQEWITLEKTVLALLTERSAFHIPSTEAEDLFTNHKLWLTKSWGSYTPQRHLGLAELYLITSDFTTYYDSRCGVGATQFLVETIRHYTSI